jgi:hypothetical protein
MQDDVTTNTNNTLTTAEIETVWQSHCLEVWTIIPRFVATMGLPEPTPTHPDTIFPHLRCFATNGQVRCALLADLNLHDRIFEAVHTDFAAAMAKGKVFRDQMGGWLNRCTQRKTWKLATPRAKQLYIELQAEKGGTDIVTNVSDSTPSVDELVSNRQVLRRCGLIAERLSLDDRQLLDAKFSGAGYAELAAIRGTTGDAVKAKACRLWDAVREQILKGNDDDNDPKTEPE